MASRLARAKLARAASALNARSRDEKRGLRLPALLLMTDEMRVPDPEAAARELPRGAGVVLRHTNEIARAQLAERLSSTAHRRGLLLLVAGDAALAARVNAAGLHLPEARAAEAAHWKGLHPSWLVTAAAHSLRALGIAARAGADAVLLASAFPTRSHLDRPSLGAARFRLLATQAPLAVYALGGVSVQNIALLVGTPLAGIAAIEGLLPDYNA